MSVNIDFGKTAEDYAVHREGFPAELLTRLLQFGIGLPAQHIVDLGTGTGTLARQFAQNGAIVTGVDIAPELIKKAQLLDQQAGVSVDYHISDSSSLPLSSCSQDVITAGQCWHWFDAASTAQECMRVLRPSGAIVICHFDWLPLRDNVVELTEALILKHSPTWQMSGGNGLYPRWLTDLALAGFEEIETFSFDKTVNYSQESWRGRIRASAGISASLNKKKVEQFDQELKQALQQNFPKDPLPIPHRVWAVIARKPNR
ncbi:class I SAM-dependent methyltransferase [Vibrio marisflavi]|uniref:Ubiquinone biosynthesis O-methyltransferase, mitochondrial n=1 Tax=Vibrio marisflavi CECT 7928 TaxID=634439 RepID=A0ABN8DXW5_9VIBR|nr:class I SAM-dependent methyltransferase [Vibrio marisflavi]CAH0536100.1 Ubiquinone biosynthesis O-methyltransferase, mitochondrial [Vibrio marisflavi CECT 7928]